MNESEPSRAENAREKRGGNPGAPVKDITGVRKYNMKKKWNEVGKSAEMGYI